MIHLYCGNGKGKTTAAFGLALRQLGHDKNVLVVQFLKDGTSGELKALRQFPNVTIQTKEMSKKFYAYMNEEEQEQTKLLQQALWCHVTRDSQEYDCILLDEIVDALQMGLLCAEEVYDFLHLHKEDREFLLTGRNPSSELQELSDYYTEFRLHKHPYSKGVQARIGIEY